MDAAVAQDAGPAHTDASLACLLAAAAGGDVDAFERFYAATVRRVLAVARGICGASLCEDALADAYFQAWLDLAKFDAARGSALAWITIIVRSRALDRLRGERRRHGGVEGAVRFEAEEQACPARGPQEQAEASEQHALLLSAFAALPPRERELLSMAYYGDCSHREISQATGLPMGTVKTLIRQSQSHLQAMLQRTRG